MPGAQQTAAIRSGEAAAVTGIVCMAVLVAHAHTVREGETLRSLSQDYGIRLKKLARLNRLRADEAIAAGQTLKLK